MKKRKGFTLIELLAVIVIIALLMAIAIPAVSKYITNSRKKTVVSSAHEFVTAVTVDVNDSKYDVKGDNTIYAIPIECIELEKGGDNPFGKWMPANDKQWAYVLIQYDSLTRNYTYGFTFKDSEGYGMYPTEMDKIDNSGKLVQKDLSLNKPTTGSYTNITAKGNWNGFDLEFDTKVVVLWAVDDGNGKNTCTIRQEVNKSEVPEYVPSGEDEEEDDTVVSDGTKAYAIYSADDQSLTFVRLDDSVQVKAGDIFLNKTVTAIYTGFEEKKYYLSTIPWKDYRESIKLVSFNDKIQPIATNDWFYDFKNLDKITGINNLYTSRVTDMRNMFKMAGYNSTIFTLDLGDNFDTSNVVDMDNMFSVTGHTNTQFTLDLGDKFDTSKVTDMSYMFSGVGEMSTIFTLDLGNKFNTSNVTNMEGMFFDAGYSSPIFELDLTEKFDTRKVTNTNRMFASVGYSNPNFTLDLGDKFDTSNVTDMDLMFNETAYLSTKFTLDLGDKFDTSKVTTMLQMFNRTGYSSKNFALDLGDKFDTSNVTNMNYMFSNTGANSSSFALKLGDKFNTSNVTTMSSMFAFTGRYSPSFTLDIGDKFDTSNVTNMNYMFNFAGYNSTNFKLDCSNWNVDKVTGYDHFNHGVESKVTPPVWK